MDLLLKGKRALVTGSTSGIGWASARELVAEGEFFAALASNAGQTLEQAERDFFKSCRPTSLLQRFIEPAEVAAMVAYVCSPRSAATNGAALRVDGGVVRSLI